MPKSEDASRSKQLASSVSDKAEDLMKQRGQGFDPQRRREIISEVFLVWVDPQKSLRTFAVLMVLAVIIAAYGMADDSEAVVIGAMLIAPLMTPVLGVAVSIVMGWPDRLLRSFLLVAAATAGAIVVGFIVQSLIPTIEVVPGALQGRTNPTLVDLSIALAAGAAGAYVQIHREALGSLAGVAVAVALVPPLAAVGMFLERGAYSDAGGAFLLYITNFAAIVFAAAVLYLISGFTPFSVLAKSRRRVQWGFAVALGGVLLVLIPLTLNGLTILNDARDETRARSAVLRWLGEDSPLEIFRLNVDGEDVEVVLAGPVEPPDAEPLAEDLAERLGGSLNLRVRWAPVIEQAIELPKDTERPDNE